MTVAKEFGSTLKNAHGFFYFGNYRQKVFVKLDSEHRQKYTYYSVGDKIIDYYWNSNWKTAYAS